MKLIGLTASVLMASVGCGPRAVIEPVSGLVTLDGKPLPGAVVRFMPKPQEDPQAVKVIALGETNDEGRYSLHVYDGPDGAVVGVNRVTISTAKYVDPDAKKSKRTPEVVPSIYNSRSTLEFEVPPGGTDNADFALER